VGSGPLVVADPIDRIDQSAVGCEIEIGADPSEGRDDPVEDFGFHAAPGATLEVSGDLLGAVRSDLAIKEGLHGSTHLAATQPNEPVRRPVVGRRRRKEYRGAGTASDRVPGPCRASVEPDGGGTTAGRAIGAAAPPPR
jgi:hypothetical protein